MFLTHLSFSPSGGLVNFVLGSISFVPEDFPHPYPGVPVILLRYMNWGVISTLKGRRVEREIDVFYSLTLSFF